MNVIINVLKYFVLYFVQAQIGTEWYNMPIPQFMVDNFIEIMIIIITINLYSTFPKKFNVLYNKIITTKQIQHTYKNITEDTLVKKYIN